VYEEDKHASASPGSNCEEKTKVFKGNNPEIRLIEEGGTIKIKAMNIIFVLDSYNQECLSRIDYFSAVLQSLSNSKFQVNNYRWGFGKRIIERGLCWEVMLQNTSNETTSCWFKD